jgi:hypothetical protein
MHRSAALPNYLNAHLETLFEWGVHDCVLFAANWASQQTGADMLVGVAPWSSDKQARRMLKNVGGLETVVDQRLSTVATNLAGDGCIGLYRHPAGETLGIFTGVHLAVPAEKGLLFVDRVEAVCAWHC